LNSASADAIFFKGEIMSQRIKFDEAKHSRFLDLIRRSAAAHHRCAARLLRCVVCSVPWFAALIATLFVSTLPTKVAAKEPFVVAMSFTSGSVRNLQGARANAGARAYIERINASGGVNGRLIQIESLEDGGLPDRHAANIRQLIKDKRAVAILGCAGDATCRASAAVALEMGVPLVAPLSGVSDLSRAKNPYVFSVRADLIKESQMMATQLVPIGASRVAILSETRSAGEAESLLRKDIEARGIKVDVLSVDPDKPETLTAAFSAIEAGQYYAVILNGSIQMIAAIINADQAAKVNWPLAVLTLANGNLPILIRGFKGRALGYTELVPNPESLSNAMARELVQDAEKYVSSSAITFDGMEAYIGARVLVEALRKLGPNESSNPRLFDVLDSMTQVVLPGFQLSFKGRTSGSDWVGTGFRARSGELRN
jgi:ABC-type branched-subunit amino acid transport system substrate-binding protein